MLQRLAFMTALATLPAAALAQAAAPSAAVCDGSAVSRAERVHDLGRALFTATALADVVAVLTIPHNPGGVSKAQSRLGFTVATLPVAMAGVFIAHRAHPGDTFWRGVMSRLTVGRTSAADVRLCLHRPDISSRNTTEEQWTYVIERPTTLGGSLRTLRLTFRDSVLADVQQTEVNEAPYARTTRDAIGSWPDRHHGFCAPPVPVIADPFPTPSDTTFAAAAIARAQADAEAASKNAAAAAAYAACMASDSAR